MFGLASTSVFGYQSTQKGKCFLQFCIYRGNITVQTFHENRLYYSSQTRVAVKDCLWFSCRGLVTFHWNYQINMLLSHLGEMTKLLPVISVKWHNAHALSHFGQMSRFTRFVAFGWNVAIYALCCIWLKCCDLHALLHLGEMSRFTRFVAFWLKCRDLRVLPGTKCLLPGT